MKRYCLLLFLVIFAISACGEMKDPYAYLSGSGGGSSGGGTGGGDTGGGGTGGGGTGGDNTSTTKTIPLSNSNRGAYALAVATPATKTQADYQTPESFYIKIAAPKTASSYIYPNLEDMAEYQFNQEKSVQPSTPDIHTQLRIKERELMKKITKDGNRLYSPLAAITPKKYTVGDTHTFNVDSSISGVSTVTAECVYISDEAYFFIPSSQKAQITPFLSQYETGFENSYTTITTKFGRESDVDSNGKVIILFFNMDREPNVIGYFYGGDKYPKSSFPDSNEADMFYMNTRYMTTPNTILATLSHEFQHMTYFDNMLVNIGSSLDNYDGDSWINEGLSMLSSYLCGDAGTGSTNDNWIQSFLGGRYDGLSLTYWGNGNYGYSAVFSHYLYETFGGDVAIKNIYKSGYGGIKAVEFAAKAFIENDKDFNEIFDNFTLALYNGTFAIPNISPGAGNLKPIKQITDGNPINFNVPAYGISFTNVNYPTSSVTFSHNGNFTVNAFDIK